jgi:predicted GIY-YIG superfamily endonuclease
VYFLKLKNGDIYIGSTNDLRRRFNSHQSGDVTSTRGYLPAVLSSSVVVEDEATARKLEIYFESGQGRRLPRNAS